MSLENKSKVICPACNHESDFTVYGSINTKLDPELKEKIISGEVFLFKCPNCGEDTLVNYEILYHDMDEKLMIQLVGSEESLKSAKDLFNTVGFDKISQGKEIIENMSKYTKRIVKSQEELAEKILINDAKFDDRVIELVKIMYLKMFYNEKPDAKLNGVYFVREENENLIIFVGEEDSFSMPIDRAFYDNVSEKLAELEVEEEFVIDSNWALKTFNKLIELDEE